MWPSRPDMSRDECRKCLRCLELDAYGNMVSVLRAQGPFTEEKQKLLSELAKVLHISNERHRAEIRRAVNDEKLSVIAEQLNGPNTYTDWAIEGRRTIPLLPRLKAHTAFTGLANSLSMVIAAANEKKLPAQSRVEEPMVKSETESREFMTSDDRPVTKVTNLHSETNARGRKRKRSSRESPDVDGCRAAKLTDSSTIDEKTNSTMSDDVRTTSPLPIKSDDCSNVVQSSTVTPSSTSDTSTRIDDLSPISVNQLTCLSTNNSHDRKINALPSTIAITDDKISNDADNFSIARTKTFATTNRRDNGETADNDCSISDNKKLNVTAIETKSNVMEQRQQCDEDRCTAEKRLRFDDDEITRDKNVINVVVGITNDDTKISRPDSTTSSTPGIKRITTSKICLTTKPVITSSTSRLVTVNSGSTASSGPGPPPHVKSTTTLTYKKLSPTKLNHHSGTKMGITLNSNKTLKINAHPNARLAAKANVIVVQKGSSRGVTLSHGGKEVLGKVIMGGKNLCLASQKSGTSVALVPHRSAPNNGDQTLTMLSTINANHAESLKTGSKTGNMIVLDIRQDVLDKNKVLSQFLEASGVFNPESKTATILTTNNVRLTTKNPNDDRTAIEREKIDDESRLSSIDETSENLEITKKNSDDLITDSDKKIDPQGVLDAQTGIYNFDTSDGMVIVDQVEETVPTSGLDIFSTALTSSDINIENFHYATNDDEEMENVTNNETSADSSLTIVDKLNELSDS